MKKAKVSKGIVHHVWPNVKPDGTVVELPPQYRGGICKVTGKEKPIPDCIVDVEDDVQQGWVWNEELQRYAPRIKKPVPASRSVLVEVVAEKLGISYEELFAEINQRKLDQMAERKVQVETIMSEVNTQLAEKIAAGETLTNQVVMDVYNEVTDSGNITSIEETQETDDPGAG